MTDKLYLMTEAQRDACIKGLQQGLELDDDYFVSDVLKVLQSLPMMKCEPVTYLRYVERGGTPDDYWTDLEICDVDTKDAFSVYTSPQPLQPITADDVTDEMVFTHNTTTVRHSDHDYKIVIASAYNAVIKHRSES